MPEGTRVHRCVNKLMEEGKPEGSAIAICQHSTQQGFATGRSLKLLVRDVKSIRTEYKAFRQCECTSRNCQSHRWGQRCQNTANYRLDDNQGGFDICEDCLDDQHHYHNLSDELPQRTIRYNLKIPPTVLTWNNGAVGKAIRAIQQMRDWSQLPLLADMLEEAGYTGRNLLTRLRQQDASVLSYLQNVKSLPTQQNKALAPRCTCEECGTGRAWPANSPRGHRGHCGRVAITRLVHSDMAGDPSTYLCDRCTTNWGSVGSYNGYFVDIRYRLRLPASVLAWNDGAVMKALQQIQHTGNLHDLPIVADMLEEAGYTEPNLLRRLRRQDPSMLQYLLGMS